MSIARHHAEWLSLVPVSGPFLSLPVLMEAFNTGLEPHDADQSRLLRQECGNWQDALEKRKADPTSHQHWIRLVLTKILEHDDRTLAEGQAIPQTLQAEVPEHHELLRPNIVVIDPVAKKPRLLVQTYPRSQDLGSYVAHSRWKASPDTRMTELLHATGVKLGLVTNGEHWMLVSAPKGETTGYASWYASLWLEEPITLRAFRGLLSASRFFNVPDDQTLEALFARSAANQQEVTDQLGYQVRRAVEVLIHSLDRADQDHGRSLLRDVPEAVLYESALTVMMRLVFLFCAEERELIPSKPFPVYEQNYSVSTISKQLRELADQHGEELLERRYDAWPRLLAAFRAVYGGLRHDDVHIPAYGGSLFNPDRFPFLEGRLRGTSWRDTEANPLPVNNRTVLHLLEALQLLQIKVPGGGPAEARRLSFRALDIEQIGHVYEGLLDHTAKRAAEPFLGLAGTRAKEPEIPLAELEKLLAKGEADLVKFLKEVTGKSESALKKSLKVELDTQEAARFRTACQSDEGLWQRVRPLAGLVRPDNFGYPVVIPKGSVFVTSGTDRRSSGTHYTPRSLTEPIVQYTLEPLVYVGPAEGKPKSEWQLKNASELLSLKICDMACGSGAFLVQAARYMAERLLESWEQEESISQKKHQARLFTESDKPQSETVRITPFGFASIGGLYEQIVPIDPQERKCYAMRIIAQRCLYGVDINPLAVEMAKLSLWLLTLAKDKPFEFLDHSIRCGDSLVGLHKIDQLRHFSLKPEADDAVLFKGPLDSAVDEAITLRLKLEGLSASTVEDVERQEKLLKEADEQIARLRCAADMLIAAEFWGENPKDKLERVRHAAVKSGYYVEEGPTEDFEQVAFQERKGRSMFHWPLVFPEVIVKRGGFDAFVGNPPFVGGVRITELYGDKYNTFLSILFCPASKKTDLCAYFLRRSGELLAASGVSGLLATNTISQGTTRKGGLTQLLTEGFCIINARPSFSWPGSASLHAAMLIFVNGEWNGCRFVNDVPTAYISDLLQPESEAEGVTGRLAENSGRCFQGSCILGPGFFLEPEKAGILISNDSSLSDVIKPAMGGQELNESPNLTPPRWIIDMGERNEQEARRYCSAFNILEELVKPERLTKDVNKYPRMVQAWWKYWHSRMELYSGVAHLRLSRVLVRSRHSEHHIMCFLPNNYVYTEALAVFLFDQWSDLADIQSSIHECWARKFSSTLETRMRYIPTDCFGTYPRAANISRFASAAGEKYYRHRSSIAVERCEGLGLVYNRFHDADESSADIQTLRDLHVEMDQAVAAAYGWTDLDLGHGFHETKQGIRFTISETARREVLQRLLKLNHERYAEEVKQGLHDKKGAAKKAAPKKKAASKFEPEESTLYDTAETEE